MSLDEALEAVTEVFEADPDDEDESDADRIRELEALATNDQTHAAICDALIGHVTAHGENFVASAAAALTLARLGARNANESLLGLFDFMRERTADYEQHQSSGHVALALAALDCKGAVPSFDEWLANTTWTASRFLARTRYARWLLLEDGAGALAYLQDESNKAGLGFAAAALADLNHTAAASVLRDIAAQISRPATQLACVEAAERLGTQSGRPDVSDRMVWMLGVLHAHEVALGREPDDQFALRARERVPTEADESEPADR